jgi:hypothetical protein
LDTVVISGNLLFLSAHYILTPEEEEEIPHPMEKVYGVLRILHACLIFRKLDEIVKDFKAINRVHSKI